MPGSAADPVRLDHYQNIVAVHWPDTSALYVHLHAQLVEVADNGWQHPIAPATDLATAGVRYCGSFKNVDIQNFNDDFLFETFTVVNDEGTLAGDESLVTISGQVTIGKLGVGPAYTTEEVPEFTVALQGAFIGGGGEVGVASGRLKHSYSGTPIGGDAFFSDYFQEQVTIRAETLPITDPRRWDLDAIAPVDGDAFLLSVLGTGAGEASHFNPIAGVTVTYDGRPCTFIGSLARFVAAGPPVGVHSYRAVFRVPEAQ